MLAAVQRDLEKINLADIPGGYTYAAMSLRLARVFDGRGDDDGPSATARLADQLGKVVSALTRQKADDGDDGFHRFEEGLSVPVME
jgi:hypothetical protein